MPGKDEYRHTASFYDLLFSRGLRSIRSDIATFLKQCNAKNIIDICCGTGEQLRLLNDDGMLLTGVDLSQAMLLKARQKSPSSIHYLETDATKLPLADNSYDGIIISFALHEKSSLHHEAIFQEACRLLTHDGHIIVADYCMPPGGYASHLVGKILIPIIERAAGLSHYNNYRNWMKQGALEGFLQKKNPGQLTLIAPHFRKCIHIYAVSRLQDATLSADLKQHRHKKDPNTNMENPE